MEALMEARIELWYTVYNQRTPTQRRTTPHNNNEREREREIERERGRKRERERERVGGS